MKNIDELFSELAQYKRIQEETNDIIDRLKYEIITYMEAYDMDTLNGNEHKATYKAVTSNRIDTTALKKDMPKIAAQYTKTTETMRFLFQ